MKRRKKNQLIAYGGLLTTLTVIFQTAPIYLPTVGLLLSPFTTVFIAIAAVSSLGLGFLVFAASAFIVAMISSQEFLILLFTTGILGLILGALLIRVGYFLCIICATLGLTMGLMMLTYVISIDSFSELSSTQPLFTIAMICTSFSFLYSTVMRLMIQKLFNHLQEIDVSFKL